MYHGKITSANKKRKAQTGGVFTETQLDKAKKKKIKTKGGGLKVKTIKAEKANVVLDGKTVSCEITGLDENPANRDYTRRKIMTKGSLLTAKTPEGKEIKVRVSSRPGQDGVVNAVTVKQ